MELVNAVKFFQGKTILITGATGFLAKVFVEKILRIQPNVNKLYLLVRASNNKSAKQRLYDEVKAVAGDISFENLGLNDSELREEMQKEIQIIVNVAASTDFSERYDDALDINTFGAFNVLNFGKKCDKVKLFLHISTAYVCGEEIGIILEKLKRRNDMNIFEEKRLAEEQLSQLQNQCIPDKAITSSMKEFGLERAKLNGWPNTYVFTKAMGEMLLERFKGDLPLVIIRPTIIASTYKQPFPGWIEGVRTIDSVLVNYGKGKLTCFPGNLNSALDVIPVDMVVNVMVVAIEVHYAQHQYSCETIYHVGTSSKNPLKLSDLRNLSHYYFTKNPWIDTNGQKVEAGKLIVFSTINRFFLYMKIKYVLPLKVFYLINKLCCQRFEKIYTNLNRRVKFILRLAEFYKPYAFFTGIFDDRNLERLQRVAEERGIDVAEFNFDSKSIDWEDYIMNSHIPGLFNQGL
ncbi:hypothetical protein ERO13_A09G094650v2 [Gossypium hirsutum]|uniref:Fatty acyl-CoA reductase n=1 Tax=Gossypium hirsutum TaxID=3635 RepID=A0A1U8HSK6_GOSHI|nr:alcohol-forming fatty acyl-CoA reductase isoform X2 [Gossypium hirsutum]KAG4183214.1 hypothetical protein ERO13_A09G094650v2 [Gossypium hirsutum]